MYELSRPFIIRPNGRPRDYIVNPDNEMFNATIEKRVQFVQGANTFISIMLLYECVRYIYYYYHYVDICSDYSYLVIGLLIGNFIWVMTSMYGFISIDSRNQNKTLKFLILCKLRFNAMLKVVLLTRIIVYIIIAWVMNKYQGIFVNQVIQDAQATNGHGTNTQIENDFQNLVCNSVYQKGLILMQCIMETIFLFVMIVLSKQIKDYVRAFQHSEITKSVIKV